MEEQNDTPLIKNKNGTYLMVQSEVEGEQCAKTSKTKNNRILKATILGLIILALVLIGKIFLITSGYYRKFNFIKRSILLQVSLIESFVDFMRLINIETVIPTSLK